MHPVLGILIGLVPAVAYGCMMPFSTKIGGTTQQKTLAITFACFVVGVITMIVEFATIGLDYSSPQAILFFFIALISGFFWYMGSFYEFKAVTAAGVSKAMPFSMVGQFVTVTLISAFFFGDWLIVPQEQLFLGLTFILVMLVGIVLISMNPNVSYEAPKKDFIANVAKPKSSSFKFYLYIGLSVVGFLLYFLIPELINKLGQKNIGDQPNWLYGGEFFVNPNTEFDKGMMFPQSLGMFIAAGATISITTLMKMRKNNVSLVQEEKVVLNIFKDKRTYLNLIPGLLQAVGNLLLLVSILLNGNTIAEPLTNLSVVIATLLGIFYMKEKKVQPYMTTTILGLVLIVIGSLACGFMDLDLSIDPTPEG